MTTETFYSPAMREVLTPTKMVFQTTSTPTQMAMAAPTYLKVMEMWIAMVSSTTSTQTTPTVLVWMLTLEVR